MRNHKRGPLADQGDRDVDVDGIAARLGHAFISRERVLEALTPPSAGLPVNNQRLEFLGDALLQACMGLLLYREKPEWNEGGLSKLRSTLVSHPSLLAWADDLRLQLRQGPRNQGKPPARGAGKPLSDAVEALLAAVHLDVEAAGGDGFATVLSLVERRFLSTIRAAREDSWKAKDAKTVLQEAAQRHRLSLPSYETLVQSGPEHAPTFRVRVSVGEEGAEGEGLTLKAAQMEAARRLLSQASWAK